MIGRLWLGTNIKAIFGKHYCIYCGGLLNLQKNSRIIKKGSVDEKCYNYDGFGDFKVVWKNFHCSNCGKSTECITQISYEAHQKRELKVKKFLLAYVNIESIRKIWIDKNNASLNSIPFFDNVETDNIYKCVYFIKHESFEYKLSLSEAKRIKLRERPYKIKKDKNFKRELKIIRQNIKSKY